MDNSWTMALSLGDLDSTKVGHIKIIATITFTCTVALVIYHSVKHCQQKYIEQTKLNKAANFLFYLIFVCSVAFNLGFVLHAYHIIEPSGMISISCATYAVSSNAIFRLLKLFVFYSFILRLQMSYNDSAFRIRKWIIIVFYALSSIYIAMLICIPWLFASDSYWRWNENERSCEYIARYISTSQEVRRVVAIYIVMTFEFSISFTLLVLFIKPLCQLNKAHNDPKLQDTMIRIGLLNSCMIVSSMISLIILAFHKDKLFAAVMICDNFVTLLCMMMMFTIHKALYKRVCGLCIGLKCCKRVSTKYMEHDVQMSSPDVKSDADSPSPVSPSV